MYFRDSSGRTQDALSASALAFLRAMDRNRNRVATECGLTGSELRAVARVAEAGSITPKLLALSMEMTTGAVTAISNRLVALQLLTRVAHPHDRRSLLLELTPAAEQITQKIYDDFQALIARAALDLDAEDKARVGSSLTSMARSIESDVDTGLVGARV